MPQEIEFILIEATLQTKQQPVVAVARRVHRFLVDQHRVDNAAHLDQLLPVAAVAREARDLARADRADFAQTHLRHHTLEASSLDASRCRAPEVVVDHFDLRPTERSQPTPHRILQHTALLVVQYLMGRGLTDIKQRLAHQVLRLDLVRDHDGSPSRS